MTSHVDDVDREGVIFSRACPVYMVSKGSVTIVVLVNHLKSKGFGGTQANNAKRLRQARRVAKIYDNLRASGAEYVVVLGDFNDTLTSAPLAPLRATDLKAAASHP